LPGSGAADPGPQAFKIWRVARRLVFSKALMLFVFLAMLERFRPHFAQIDG
jgi:hypothetical protein